MDMEGLVNLSDGWEAQLVQLNKVFKFLAIANEMERTGVGVGVSVSYLSSLLSSQELDHLGRLGSTPEKKRSRFQDHAGDEHLGVTKSVSLDDILQNVANLVCLIEAENDFVRHSVKKILIALSDYFILKAQMSSWCSLLYHVWNVLSRDHGKGMIVEIDGNKETGVPSSVNQPLDHEVNDSKKSWAPVVCGLEIVRCILKSCVNENVTVDEHTEVFLRLLAEKICKTVKMTCPETGNQGHSLCSERGLAWSALLKLFCTAIACCNLETEDVTSTNTELQLILVEKIGGCVPLLSEIALSPHQHTPSVRCPSSFLRHKVLRIMIGLSKWFEVKPNLALQCLQALRKEGADLIGFSLLENGTCSTDNSLMRSSFLTSFVHTQVSESLPRSGKHLHCRAIFLLFRIWSLAVKQGDRIQTVRQRAFQQIIFKRNNPEGRKELEDRAPLASAEIHHHGLHCSNTRSRGGGRSVDTGDIQTSCQCGDLLEKHLKQEASAAIQEWLRLQSDAVTADGLEDFSMAFVGLYLDEDDLMIESLLLLTKLRSSLLALEDTNLTIATALSPAELFHAFLQTLSYDHTVLLDFLISENTGTLFLRYLMLCTGLFIRPGTMELSRKPSSLGLAKESLNCLSQLKASIERLCRRKLFPYNPSSLLKRVCQWEAGYGRSSLRRVDLFDDCISAHVRSHSSWLCLRRRINGSDGCSLRFIDLPITFPLESFETSESIPGTSAWTKRDSHAGSMTKPCDKVSDYRRFSFLPLLESISIGRTFTAPVQSLRFMHRI